MTRRFNSFIIVSLVIILFLVTAGCMTNFGFQEKNSTQVTSAPYNADNSSKVIAIATSMTHNLALRANGTILAWTEGRSGSDWGEYDIPKNLTNVTAIGAGEGFSVALTNEGNVVVWGCNWGPPPQKAPPDDFHVCDKGGINCPCKVPANLTHVKSISVGRRHILALKDDGTIAAWGENASRQCRVPVGLKNATAVSAGGYMSMALREDGTVAAWGWYNGHVPKGTYKGIVSGYDYGLLLEHNGSVRMFTGAEEFESPYNSAYLSGLTNVTAVSDYDRRSFLALRDNGTVIYRGRTKSSALLENVTGLHNITAIAAQGEDILALKDDGTVINWGFCSSNHGPCDLSGFSVKKF